MDLCPVHCLGWLLVLLLFSHARGAERDVTSPLATVPVENPEATSTTNPAAMPATGTGNTPSVAASGGGGGSWCVASPSASTAALQVALDYACGQGGVDCSAINSGGGCFNPNTVRDHASYAFNAYYQKNPVQTSCDFGGAAILTSTDPSSPSCKYASTSTGASVLNTSTPTTPTFGGGGYDNPPPGYGNSPPLYGSLSPPGYSDNIGGAAAMAGSRRAVLSMACLLVAI
uniref:X8 domain-containing protein n=1 Tax=Leersia perrieri TaxID=77586 RepID=A0A0D9WK90_9ORYZ